MLGGKLNGFKTVLVETGMYNPKDIDEKEAEFLKYADHIVPTVNDAVELILRQHNIHEFYCV